MILTRRHIYVHNDDHYVMCRAGVDETIDHLFFLCPFAQECWNRIGFNWDIGSPHADRIQLAANHQKLPFFLEASMLAAWEIWKARNDKVFNRRDPSSNVWFNNFKFQCNL